MIPLSSSGGNVPSLVSLNSTVLNLGYTKFSHTCVYSRFRQRGRQAHGGNFKISIRAKFSGFGLAQIDLANGTRSQVYIKTPLNLFHMHLESRAVRKIRLRYREINQFISMLSQHDFRVIT